MATATMLGIDTARTAGTGVHLEVVVSYSGSELPSPDVRMIEFDVDPGLSLSQFQTALADGIRTRGVELGYSIPTNAVNVISFTKG